MERTLLQKRELDWLPPRYRAIRWAAAGGIWTTLGVGVGALGILFHGHFNPGAMAQPLVMMVAGGLYAGDRLARRVLRSRLRQLARGAVDVAHLPAEPDGELVHVLGRVRARALGGVRGQVEAMLDATPAVWRRVLFQLDGQTRLVHETAVDFQLVGAGGEPIVLETDNAQLLAPEGKLRRLADGHPAVARLEALPLPQEVQNSLRVRQKRRDKGKRVRPTIVRETLLRDGDEIEVLGYKSRAIDPMMSERMERDTPFRTTLRGGKSFPLLIAPRAG